MAAVQVSGLTKRFGSVTALDNVGFQIQEGEIFGYLGPNGAGKTTTINILSGLLERDSGEVSILGHDIARNPVAVKKRIGVVPEESNLYPELTCRRNLEYLGALYGLSRKDRRQRTEALLQEFRLEQWAAGPFRALSRGLKRRMTIAAALIHSPEVLFLDEPTVGLDVPSARALRDLIVGVNRRGTTVLLTTHNLGEAEELSDRVLILIRGKVVATGTPQEIGRLTATHQRLDVTFSSAVEKAVLRKSCPAVRQLVCVDGEYRLIVSDVDAALREIVEFSSSGQAKITSISSQPPSLEEAFVSLLDSQGTMSEEET